MTIRFGNNPRFYPKDGKQLISVTSMLTLLAKNALIPWSANCAIDYIRDRTPEVIDLVFKHNNKWDRENIKLFNKLEDEIYGIAKFASKDQSGQAADYGTYIHTLCKYYFNTGIEIESPHEMTQKLMTSFYAWCKKHNVKPIETEVVVYGDGYAGRVDLICEIDQFWYKSKDKQDQELGRRKRVITLIDFKTGKGSYYSEWYLQTAAYRRAYYVTLYKTERYPKHATHHGVLKFNKETCRVNYRDMTKYEATRKVLKNGQFVLLPSGKFKTEKYTRTYEMDLEAFMLLVRFWELTNE